MPAYTPTDWTNNAGTPLDDVHLDHMEAGILAANQASDPATASTTGTIRLAGDLAGTATAPTVPLRVVPIYNFDGSNPARPNTQAAVLWIAPDTNRPATNGTTTGGSYAAAAGDLGAFYS